MYANETLGKMDKICPAAEKAGLGTVIDALVTATTGNTKYSGSLLTAEKINALNNMCIMGKEVQLGTVVNNLLTASKNGTTVVKISDAHKNIINKACIGLQLANLGGTLQGCADAINTHGVISDDAEITAFTIENQTGETFIDRGNYIIRLNMPFESVVTGLIPTFTTSAGATIKIGSVAQVSGVTANDFTEGVTYIVKSASGDVTHNYTVLVTVLEASTETEILTFGLPGQVEPSVIDSTNNTVDVTLPFDTDIIDIQTAFTLSEGATAKVGEIEQHSGVTLNTYTLPVVYSITAQDGVATEDWTVTVTVAAE